MDKIIAYDFMGVLDIKESYKVNDRELAFRIRKQVDLDKAAMLFTLARETGSKLVSISTFSKHASINRLVMSVLQRSEKEEHAEIAEWLSNNRIEAKKMFINASFDSKQSVIDRMREKYPDAKIVAFEDEATLTSCEFIRINHGGLNEEYIQRAKSFLEG